MSEASIYSVTINEAEYPYDIFAGLFQLTPEEALRLNADLAELERLGAIGEHYVEAEAVRPKIELDRYIDSLHACTQ